MQSELNKYQRKAGAILESSKIIQKELKKIQKNRPWENFNRLLCNYIVDFMFIQEACELLLKCKNDKEADEILIELLNQIKKCGNGNGNK